MTTVGQQPLEVTLLELNRSAKKALEGGDVDGAISALSQATTLERKSLTLWLNYASVLRRAGRLDDALGAVDEALKLQPRDFNALLLQGALLDRAGRVVEAGRVYGIALLFQPPPPNEPSMAAAIARAVAMNKNYRADLAAAIDAKVSQDAQDRDITRFVDQSAGRAKRYDPQPTQYFFPGLPSHEFYDRSLFPWLAELEAATDAIREELEAGMRAQTFVPYVDEPETAPIDQWVDLNRSLDWSALHLIRGGAVDFEARTLYPKTLAALSRIPQPQVQGRSPSAMFSALKPGVRIPAHTGVSNARLVVHLPLVIPLGCTFRVGSETREWKVGEAWVFDDTVEHEAFNGSDAVRIILIADIWNCFMNQAQRQAYTAMVAAVDDFHGYDARQAEL